MGRVGPAILHRFPPLVGHQGREQVDDRFSPTRGNRGGMIHRRDPREPAIILGGQPGQGLAAFRVDQAIRTAPYWMGCGTGLNFQPTAPRHPHPSPCQLLERYISRRCTALERGGSLPAQYRVERAIAVKLGPTARRGFMVEQHRSPDGRPPRPPSIAQPNASGPCARPFSGQNQRVQAIGHIRRDGKQFQQSNVIFPRYHR